MTVRRLRRATAGAVVALLAVPVLVAAAAGPDPERLPPVPSCAEAGSVTRVGAWASVRGPRFVERPLGRGQAITASVVAPLDQRRVFATNGSSIMGSRDTGCTWDELFVLPDVPTDEDPTSVAGSRITRLVVPEDARGRTRVLAVVDDLAGDGRPHVLVSEDGTADSFERREDGLPMTGRSTDLVVAPTNPDFLWLSVRFSPAAPGPSDGGPLPTLPTVPGLPPVGGSPAPGATGPRGGLFASVDGGRTWSARLDVEDPAVTTSAIDDLVTDPLSANQLWAVGDGVLRHSADGGRTFRAAVPTPAEQAQRGWRVTTLVVDAQPGRARVVRAFTASSAQQGGPRMLTSTDGGATFDETAAPGPVDSAVLVGPEQDLLAVSTSDPAGSAATVQVLTDGRFADLTPVRGQRALSVSTDRTPTATLHARLPGALLRYVGPLLTPPADPPPVIGEAVVDGLPPLGEGAFAPAADAVVLESGRSITVDHRLAVPRRATPLDLYFLVDTTLSMRDDVPLLVRDVRRLLDRLRAEGVDLRLGLGEFKGQESSVGYRRVVGIGPSRAEFEAGLSTLNGDGSGLEMQLIALEQALDGAGESPADLVPAACKATDGNPDRFVLDERRTTPPVVPGQQADFAPGHAQVVVMVTDTTFLRPAGTRLTPDCRVDVEPVAAAYAARGIHVVGIGVDDVDNPRTAEDLALMARGTTSLQPGPPCAAALVDGPAPHPAVCRDAVGLQSTLLSLVQRVGEPVGLVLRRTGPDVVDLPALPRVDLRRPAPLSVPLTYTCGDTPSESSGTIEASVVQERAGTAGTANDVVATLRWTLRCVPPPPAAAGLPPAVAGAPVIAGVLPPPGIPPPPAPPAQAVQPQVQTQPQANPQAQTGTQEDSQEQVDLALALQSGQRSDEQVELAMSARDAVVPQPVWLLAVTAVTAGASGLALRAQARQRAALRERLVTAR